MILQIVTTYVDDDQGDCDTYDVELQEGELGILELVAQHGIDEDVVFRGKTYNCGNDVHDILRDIGKRVNPDHTISVYRY